MKWETVKLEEYNGYKLKGNAAFARAKKFTATRYPAKRTIKRLKELGVQIIIYQNGDSITI